MSKGHSETSLESTVTIKTGGNSADTACHKGDSESESLQQPAGNEPCRQSEAEAQNRGFTVIES